MWWFEWYFGYWGDDRVIVVADSLAQAQELAYSVIQGNSRMVEEWESGKKDKPATVEAIITGIVDLTFGGV